MEVFLPKGTYILVIDTTVYTGNFQHKLCAFVTGYSDDDRNEADAEAFRNEEPNLKISDKMIDVDHKEYGPVRCTIRATPGRFNNGMGYCYDAGDDMEEVRRIAVQKMAEYQAPYIAQVQTRLDNNDFESADKPGAWTKEACLQTIEFANQSIAGAGQFVEYPAYESVAIFFSEPLTDMEMAAVARRANSYASSHSKPFAIRDIYMMRHDTVEERLP